MGFVEEPNASAWPTNVPSCFSALADLVTRGSQCRAFLPEPVGKPHIEQMLAAAQMTSSWCNTQPWHVTIASGAALDRLRTALSGNFDSLRRLFGAPHVLLVHTRREMGVYATLDCGLYLATAMLAAQALGMSMAPEPALARHGELIGDLFGMPEETAFVAGATFGFPDPRSPFNANAAKREETSGQVTWASV